MKKLNRIPRTLGCRFLATQHYPESLPSFYIVFLLGWLIANPTYVAGGTVYVDGNKVVITGDSGSIVTQWNDQTSNKVRNHKWIPD